jgi:hypothetical protein
VRGFALIAVDGNGHGPAYSECPMLSAIELRLSTWAPAGTSGMFAFWLNCSARISAAIAHRSSGATCAL